MTTTDRALEAAIAVTRFGMGARPGEIAEATRDPRGFLRAQIRREGAEPLPGDGETSAQRIAAFRDYQQDRRAAKAGDPADKDPMKQAQKMLRDEAGGDFLARAKLGATTDAGFRERWALFWANHFTVSATKLQTATVVGPFETEAIRPHVFGRFADLLVAAETHPAMLLYLDQAQSIGPNSPVAQRIAMGGRGGLQKASMGRQAGLNENLAREILELHTVGVEGGYTQADVTEFARAMTGLAIGLPGANGAVLPMAFRVQAHEPGARTVMGVSYDPGGAEQAGAILSDLARKPQTARFVSYKIARHFVADDPPAPLVARLAETWQRTEGDLARVAETLVSSPEAWAPQPLKFKTPYEFVVSSHRAAGVAPNAIGKLAPTLTALGQKPFSAPSPKGWAEEAEAWAAPDAIVKRMQFAQAFSAAAAADRDPRELAAAALGARLNPATALAVARAESRAEGLALLLMSPEFQRR